MKKLLIILLSAAVVFTLAACNTDDVSSALDDSFVNETPSVDVSSEDTSDVIEVSTNVALDKRVYFSSEKSSMRMLSRFAVDGDVSTCWSSNTTSAEIDEWIMIDLGKNYNIEEITIKWGASYASEYNVLLSRGGIEFTEIYSTTEGAGSDMVINAKNTVGRYLKINCKKVNSVLGTYMGATIKEVDVTATEAEDQTLGREKEAMIPTKIVVPDESDVYVMGRNYKYNELIWAGATFEYKCTGSVAGVVLNGAGGNENIRFEASIDGGAFTPYSLEKGATAEFIFADDLDPDKEHTVCIMKTGDVWEPTLTVKGVIVSEDADMVKNHTREYDLKIEFIGDSITSGGVTNGYAKCYVYLVADALNANFNVVSRSGQGLYRFAGLGDAIPLKTLYAGVNGNVADYDYSYDPDIVVLNIGTNDGANVRNTEDEKDKASYRETFKEMYVEMLEIIHEKNPNAKILCTGGLMGDIGQVKTQIAEAVETFKAQNPDVEIYLEYLSIATDAGKNTDWHPGVAGHAKGAEELIPIIKRIMNIN